MEIFPKCFLCVVLLGQLLLNEQRCVWTHLCGPRCFHSGDGKLTMTRGRGTPRTEYSCSCRGSPGHKTSLGTFEGGQYSIECFFSVFSSWIRTVWYWLPGSDLWNNSYNPKMKQINSDWYSSAPFSLHKPRVKLKARGPNMGHHHTLRGQHEPQKSIVLN